MERFQIRRKISDTLLGAVYEGQLRHAQRRSSVALKCSSLTVADRLQAREQKRGVDNPLREWAVVEQLIASGGHQHVVHCYDQFVSSVNSSGQPPNVTRTDDQQVRTNGVDQEQVRPQTEPQNQTQAESQAQPETESQGNSGASSGTNQERERDRDTMMVLISEFCRGGDLHTLLETSPGGRMSEREALQFMLQIARGVQFLHGLGFAHRDLSLENVLLRNGVCKITDFALACRVDERSVECVGKDLYMAPEVVAMGEEGGDGDDQVQLTSMIDGYDPAKADVWSMGVMLFVMLTGSRLVLLASPQDKSFLVVQAHGATALLSAWSVAEGLSSSTLRVLDSMLEVDATRRASVLGVLRALEQIT